MMLLDGGICQNKNAKVNLSVELPLLVIQILCLNLKGHLPSTAEAYSCVFICNSYKSDVSVNKVRIFLNLRKLKKRITIEIFLDFLFLAFLERTLQLVLFF